MKYIIIILCLVIATACRQAPSEFEKVNKAIGDVKLDDEIIYTVVDQMPSPAEGLDEIHKFISKNIKYPHGAGRPRAEGTVFVAFVVTKVGEITSVKTIKGVNPELDAEAERVTKLLPNWIPGKHMGAPVNVRFVIPVKFALE
jgi:TonB family protein